MTYVLDTNVVSALRVPGRHPAVAAWADSVEPSEQFISAMTLAEIERGVIARERTDPTQASTSDAGSRPRYCLCLPAAHCHSMWLRPASLLPIGCPSILPMTMR